MENSRGKQNGTQWGLWLGLAVLGGISVYYYPLFVLTMLVIPAIWAAMAFRTHPAMLLAAGALVTLFGFLMGYGAVSSLCILGMVAPAGAVLWLSQRERMGNFQSVLFVAILLTFGLFLLFCVPDLIQSGDPYASIRSYFLGALELFQGTYLYASAMLLVNRLDEMMVAVFFAFAGVYALVNVLLLHAFNRRRKDMPLCPLGPFGTWSAPYSYTMAMGALGLFATFLTLSVDTPTVSTLSMLFYEMWAMPLIFTGINGFYRLLRRRLPVNRARVMFGTGMGLGLVFSPQFAQMALLLLGLVGVIRQRRAGKERR